MSFAFSPMEIAMKNIETALFAAQHPNLWVIVDYNKLQGFGYVIKIIYESCYISRGIRFSPIGRNRN